MKMSLTLLVYMFGHGILHTNLAFLEAQVMAFSLITLLLEATLSLCLSKCPVEAIITSSIMLLKVNWFLSKTKCWRTV